MSRVGFVVLIGVIVASGVALVLRLVDARRAPPIVVVDEAAERPVVVLIDGAVATPGVLTLPAGSRLNDAVGEAGGFSRNADSASLNLARLLVDGERITVLDTRSAEAGSEREPMANLEIAQSPASPIASTVAPADRVATMPAAATSDASGADGGQGDHLLDINSATATQLVALPGIGPVLSQRIVAYRDENGPFASVDELVAVEGISARMVDAFRSRVTAGAVAA